MRELTFINLTEAYLCADCQAIGKSANRCPRCQSNALIAISRAIPPHVDSINIVSEPPEEHELKAA
jgi:hypothetical protein